MRSWIINHLWIIFLSIIRLSLQFCMKLFFLEQNNHVWRSWRSRFVKKCVQIFGWHLKNKLPPKERPFTRIQRNRESTATSRQDNHTWLETTLPVAGGRKRGRRANAGGERTRRRACLELLFLRVFTDERKRLNGQVGENDDILPLSLSYFRFTLSYSCKYSDSLRLHRLSQKTLTFTHILH